MRTYGGGGGGGGARWERPRFIFHYFVWGLYCAGWSFCNGPPVPNPPTHARPPATPRVPYPKTRRSRLVRATTVVVSTEPRFASSSDRRRSVCTLEMSVPSIREHDDRLVGRRFKKQQMRNVHVDVSNPPPLPSNNAITRCALSPNGKRVFLRTQTGSASPVHGGPRLQVSSGTSRHKLATYRVDSYPYLLSKTRKRVTSRIRQVRNISKRKL